MIAPWVVENNLKNCFENFFNLASPLSSFSQGTHIINSFYTTRIRNPGIEKLNLFAGGQHAGSSSKKLRT